MKELSEKAKKLAYSSIIVTTLGVVITTTLPYKSLGVVGIAIGGLLLIATFSEKNKSKK